MVKRRLCKSEVAGSSPVNSISRHRYHDGISRLWRVDALGHMVSRYLHEDVVLHREDCASELFHVGK